MGKNKNAQKSANAKPETIAMDGGAPGTAAARSDAGVAGVQVILPSPVVVVSELEGNQPDEGSDINATQNSAAMENAGTDQGVSDDERSGDQGNLAERNGGSADGSGSAGDEPHGGRAGIHADGTAETIGENAAAVDNSGGPIPAGDAGQEIDQLTDTNNMGGGADNGFRDHAEAEIDRGSAGDQTGAIPVDASDIDAGNAIVRDEPNANRSGSDRPEPVIDPHPDFISKNENGYDYDGRIQAAISSFVHSYYFALKSESAQFEAIGTEALLEACRFIRKIKKDATPQVLVQHLYLSKLIPGNKPCRVQEVALSCMAHTLLALDGHHDLVVAENQRQADLAAREAEPKWHQDDLSYGESDIAPNTF